MEKHYVMITKFGCSYCDKAIALLQKKGKKFIYTDLGGAPDILAVTLAATGHPTVPVIYEVQEPGSSASPLEQKLIGGYTELAQHLGEGP